MAFRSVSTAGDSSGNALAITRPSGAATDDILRLHFYAETQGLTPSISPGSWTKITAASGAQSDTGPVNFENYEYWSRQAAGDTGDITVTPGATTWRIAVLAAYSGRSTISDPQDGTGTYNATGTASGTATATGMTTLHDNADLIMVEGNSQGRTHSAWTSPLNERADFGGQGLADGVQTTAGASGSKTVTLTTVPTSPKWTASLTAFRDPAGDAAAFIAQPPLTVLQAVHRSNTY